LKNIHNKNQIFGTIDVIKRKTCDQFKNDFNKKNNSFYERLYRVSKYYVFANSKIEGKNLRNR